MPETEDARPWFPSDGGIDDLRTAATGCHGCELWRDATQVVFSRGAASAPMMLVGEQPGDREDLSGEPFVGPAGRLLTEVLDEAGIAEDEVYLTNAVKHFRFERRGKRRIHEKPAVAHIVACRPWLEAEIAAVRPGVIVALGATAARALLNRTVRIGEERGRIQESAGPSASPVLVTVHPSSLLRLREAEDRARGRRGLADDLRRAHDVVA